MGAFIAARIDDMLRIYGDNEVADALAEAEKVCEPLTPYNEQLARHRGAAAHGLADIEDPGDQALHVIDKLARRKAAQDGSISD